jgi:hypothetical protein
VSDIRLSSSLDSANLFLDKRITVARPKNKDTYKLDTVVTVYKQCKLRIAVATYFDEEDKKWKQTIENLYSADSTIQTISGIKIGDDKFDIIKRIERNRLVLIPESELSESFTEIILDDGYGKSMIFHFKHNKLFALEIEYGEFGC